MILIIIINNLVKEYRESDGMLMFDTLAVAGRPEQ